MKFAFILSMLHYHCVLMQFKSKIIGFETSALHYLLLIMQLWRKLKLTWRSLWWITQLKWALTVPYQREMNGRQWINGTAAKKQQDSSIDGGALYSRIVLNGFKYGTLLIKSFHSECQPLTPVDFVSKNASSLHYGPKRWATSAYILKCN